MTNSLSINACGCHYLDGNKSQILMWKLTNADKSTTYLLKIAEQKFIGQARTDKKGETYWKFKNSSEEPNLSEKEGRQEFSDVEKTPQNQA